MFSVIHRDGSSDWNPPLEALEALVDELASADREHGDVAVVHEETAWSMAAHRDGRLVFESIVDGGERHMLPVGRRRVLELWRALIAGDVATILREPWVPGYGR